MTLSPYQAPDCVGRSYNRLNKDYEPLHALSRFFLENSGPSYEVGDRKMLPFLVDMAQLFELFVAEWLKTHLPRDYMLRTQESVDIDSEGSINLRVDLVLYNALTNLPICVLDTKYKDVQHASQDDIGQVNLYAGVIDCNQAVLIYPRQLPEPLDEVIKGTRIRSVTFDISGDLEAGGQKFLQEILQDHVGKNQAEAHSFHT